MSKPSSFSFSYIAFIHFSFLLVLSFSGCNSKELSRSKAESLITESAEFKYPAVIDLKRANENEALFREKKSNSETIEESKAIDLKGYLLDDARLAVVHHLELINIEQTMTKEEPGVGVQVPASRYFLTKFRANDKGKAFWKEMGLDATDESIPIAKKEFVRIDGITQQSQSDNQAYVDFTWKFTPNSLGRMFDPNTTEFKSLPVELQRQIRGETGMPPRNRTENWNNPTERKSKALFQRYDDGWRLIRILN
jgi:hypothetical protein